MFQINENNFIFHHPRPVTHHVSHRMNMIKLEDRPLTHHAIHRNKKLDPLHIGGVPVKKEKKEVKLERQVVKLKPIDKLKELQKIKRNLLKEQKN